MSKISLSVAVAIFLIVAGGLLVVSRFFPSEAPALNELSDTDPNTDRDNQHDVMVGVTVSGEAKMRDEKTVPASDLPGAAPAFTFLAVMPASWQAEVIPASEAVNFFDPEGEGENNLEKSQIFMRHFSGNDFLTLATVTIRSRESLTIKKRPAVRYVIAKKPEVPDFPNQPSWRNEQHMVTDIRVADTNPSVFYVIAKRPDLDARIYQRFLENLAVTAQENAPANTGLTEPVAEFRQRLTKKPFGIQITPATSPVQPERFSGWHTGVDIEYEDAAGDVVVKAVTNGNVVQARTASGYGGVVAVQHEINGQEVVAIYGHLDPRSLPSVGQVLTAGDPVGILGDGGTAETDGERKHLHFALLRGTSVDLRGYVPNESELGGWINPAVIFP